MSDAPEPDAPEPDAPEPDADQGLSKFYLIISCYF